MPRYFGPYPAGPGSNPKTGLGAPVQTVAEAEADGAKTGAAWTQDYHPGGPWVCRPSFSHNQDPRWLAYCAATAENHEAWHRGFNRTCPEQVRDRR